MKILVFSDSHRSSSNMARAMEDHVNDADCFVHLGDGTAEFLLFRDRYIGKSFTAVAGNYEDYMMLLSPDKPQSAVVLELEGYRFLLTHGHKFGVQYGTETLLKYAADNMIDVVLFGHTHEKYNEYISGEHPIRLFNPGSISLPRDGEASYGIIDIRGKDIMLTNALIGGGN